MKQLFILAITFLIIGCNSDDESYSSSQSQKFFNPPEWIQGKWLVDDPNIEFGFEFTNDNFIIIQNSGNINYGEILQMQDDMGINVSVNETFGTSEYGIRINIQGTSTTYYFTKTNSTTILYNNTNFYKQ